MPCNEIDTTFDVTFSLMTMRMFDVFEEVIDNMPEKTHRQRQEKYEAVMLSLGKMNAGVMHHLIEKVGIPAEEVNKIATAVTGRMVESLHKSGKSIQEQMKFISEMYGATEGMIGQPDRSTSGHEDPLAHLKESQIDFWISHGGTQLNWKANSGPDRGYHRWCDLSGQNVGSVGPMRNYGGKEYRGVPGERPKQVDDAWRQRKDK